MAVFPRHLAETKEHREVLAAARFHRIAVILYSASRRVLELTEFSITLTYKQYYNSVRRMAPNRDDSLTIDGLLVALFNRGFIYRIRVYKEMNEKKEVVNRKLL